MCDLDMFLFSLVPHAYKLTKARLAAKDMQDWQIIVDTHLYPIPKVYM